MSGRRRPAEVLDAEGLARIEDQLMRVLATLSEREVGVVRLFFGLVDGEPRSLDEIGQVYGVTGPRVRQILERTTSKLQAAEGRSDSSPVVDQRPAGGVDPAVRDTSLGA